MYNSLDKFYELTAAKTEKNYWDYKQDFHIKPDKEFYEILKDILAFGNSGGGWIVIGVNNDGEIKGVTQKLDITTISNKVQTALGQSVNLELNYYEIEWNDNEFIVGLLYIYDFEKVITSPKTFHDHKGKTIVLMDTVYARRDSSSRPASGEDLTKIIFRLRNNNNYIFSEEELKLLERNRQYYREVTQINDFLTGNFKFNASNFGDKLNYIFNAKQSEYSKQEIGLLLGLELDYIEDYFEGRMFPKLEHILRAVEIFDLRHDYFFQTIIQENPPFINNPIVTHILLSKIKRDKFFVVKLGMGNVLKEIFHKLSLEFAMFVEWLKLKDRYSKSEIESAECSFLKNHISTNYEKYLIDLEDDVYFKFKRHLKVQFYKELELANTYDDRPLSEAILYSLCSSTTERVCKFINETIKEIILVGDELKVEFNFLYEVQNKICRTRKYLTDDFEVKFIEEISLDKLTETYRK